MSDDAGRATGAGQLREEAAQWFARMRGPDAEEHRDEFERWLARGALHRAAYNRIGQVFTEAKVLKAARVPRSRQRSGPIAAALSGVGLLLLGVTIGRHGDLDPTPTVASADVRQLSTPVGLIRKVSLVDGSAVTLDTDTLVITDFGTGHRGAILRRGRARFAVKPGRERFSVAAGRTIVATNDGVIDIELRDDQVSVDVLEGRSVTVGALPVAGASDSRATLAAGQSLSASASDPAQRRAGEAAAGDWTNGSHVFDRATLAQVADQANRYAVDRIVIPEDDVAKLVVSGTFKLNNPPLLAARLAKLFDLQIIRSRNGEVELRRKAH